ncbi:TPR-like protein [Setomelanomma holmii]|uniref:TPR-like protein n=1 Tax=Setomelanomma holmii TaxID=210430 RepID=A0A9P4LNS7_9PLEO|nr:TPR-like protein [Setomelanomma holmii]
MRTRKFLINPGPPHGQVGGPPAIPEVVHIPPVSQQAQNAKLFRNAADEKVAAGDFASAIALYEQAIRLTPEDSELLLCWAMAYGLSNPPQYQSALQDANSALQLNPESWYAWHAKGEILGYMSDFDGAEEAFQQVYASVGSMDKIRVQTSIGELRKKWQLANTLPPQIQAPPQSVLNTPYQQHSYSPYRAPQQSYYPQPQSHAPPELPSPSSPLPSSTALSTPSLTVPQPRDSSYSSPSTPAPPSPSASPYISPPSVHAVPSSGSPQAYTIPIS